MFIYISPRLKFLFVSLWGFNRGLDKREIRSDEHSNKLCRNNVKTLICFFYFTNIQNNQNYNFFLRRVHPLPIVKHSNIRKTLGACGIGLSLLRFIYWNSLKIETLSDPVQQNIMRNLAIVVIGKFTKWLCAHHKMTKHWNWITSFLFLQMKWFFTEVLNL